MSEQVELLFRLEELSTCSLAYLLILYLNIFYTMTRYKVMGFGG